MNLVFTQCNFLLSISLLLMLSACGGGGGGPATVAANTTDTDISTGTGNNNGSPQAGALGFLYYADRDRILRHDLVTGERRIQVITDFRFSESASASDDLSLFNVFNNDYTTAAIYDANAKPVLGIKAEGETEFNEPMLFSPDNKKFLLYRKHRYKDLGQLEIRDFKGVISYLNYGLSGWDWVSNEELLLSGGDSIYRLRLTPEGEPAGEPERLIQFPGESIWDISVSPDATQVAFIKRGATVHIMNIDGGGDRQIAGIFTDPSDTLGDLVAVRWSPWNNAVVVTARGITIGPYGMRACTHMSVFPVNQSEVFDLGDKDYWVSDLREDGLYYTCESDMYSISWGAN